MIKSKKSFPMILGFFISTMFLFSLEKEQIDKIDKIFESFDSTHTPGIAMAIVQNNQIVYKKAFGMASLELKVPNTTKTVFRIGSVSKQFTAACVAKLALSNRISMEDQLTKYFPELPKTVYDPVKIKHLVFHTSGIRDSEALYPFMGIEYSQWFTHDMLLKMLANQQALSFTPGKRMEYSNSGYTLLALLVERVSGKSFVEFIQEHLFNPLAMRNTFIQEKYNMVIPGRAAGYSVTPDGYKNWMTNNQLIGHDAIYTSVEDMGIWIQAFFNGGLDKQLIETMIRTEPFNDGSPNKYAHGIVVTNYKGQKTYEHGGWYVGYTAYCVVFPELKFGVASLANVTQGNRRSECLKIAEIVLAEQFATSLQKLRQSAPEINKKQLKQLRGRYLGLDYGGRMGLEITNGSLRFSGAKWGFEPSPFGKNEYINYDRRVTLKQIYGEHMDGDIKIDVITSLGKIDRFKKVKGSSTGKTDPVELIGEYWSDEIEAKAEVKAIEGKVILLIGLFKGELSWEENNIFSTGNAKVTILRNQNGMIKGFKLSAYGFQGLLFNKKL